ncbi:MAG: hypothetical protein AAF390_02000 [Pseudomonadota bacterium]
MADAKGADDPKGLIRDAYEIEGISKPECRSIFLDWALSIDGPPGPAISRLLEVHGEDGHPMTDVLREGLADAPAARRRGGRRARLSG